MGDTNNTGRSKRGAKHVRLYEWLLASPAYRSLGVYARALLVEINRPYNGTNNGEISLSWRQASKLLNCSEKPIRKAFGELQDRGFILVNRKGSFSCKFNIASTWTLTQHSCGDKLPTKEFMRWKPVDKLVEVKSSKKKSRRTLGTGPAYPRYEQEPENLSNMANRRTLSTPCGDFGAKTGVPRGGTYSIPQGAAPTTELATAGVPTQGAKSDDAECNVIPISKSTNSNEMNSMGDLANGVISKVDFSNRSTRLFGNNSNERAAQ